MLARDFHIRITAADGKNHIQQHRVWDADRFLTSTAAAYAKDQENPCKVTVATEADYREQQKKGAAK